MFCGGFSPTDGDVLRRLLSRGWDVLRRLLSRGWDVLRRLLSHGGDVLRRLLSRGWDVLRRLLSRGWDVLRRLLSRGGDVLRRLLSHGWDVLRRLLSRGGGGDFVLMLCCHFCHLRRFISAASTVLRRAKIVRRMARPIATSAAATVMMNMAKMWPASSSTGE